MKLPKSFLAVNLSETHTFHKKEELEEDTKDMVDEEGQDASTNEQEPDSKQNVIAS